MTWDTSTPADNEALSQGASRIRELKSDLESALATEGVFPGPTPASPIFRWIGRSGNTASRPAPDAANPGSVYFNTQTGAVEKDNGTSYDTYGLPISGNVALHQPVPVVLNSVSGTLTLTEAGNSFEVGGTEDLTAIQGWSSGIVMIRWTTKRKVTHNALSLILPGYTPLVPDRYVNPGDISWFEFFGTNNVREVNFRGVNGNEIPGTIRDFASDEVPKGWLLMDGTSYLRTDKPGLFAVIGTRHGAPDALSFRVPDERGRFRRAKDGGAGRDPDAGSRTAPQPSDVTDTGQSGDNVGSVQTDELRSHTHTGTPSIVAADGFTGQLTGTGGSTGATGGAETRPTNIYMLSCIKE